MKRIFILLSLFVSFLVLASCGPSQSTVDRENQQILQYANSQRALYFALAGRYVGKLSLGGDDTAYKVGLSLTPASNPATNPSRGGPTESPNLTGSLNICAQGTVCFQDVDTTEVLDLVDFSSGLYDPASGRLTMAGVFNNITSTGGSSGSSSTSSSTNGSTSVSTSTTPAALELTVDGTHISGKIYRNQGVFAGSIDVRRVN